MTTPVPANKIESIVGIERHPTEHYARAVSKEDRVYLLHAQECLDSTPDLTQCHFSLALDSGIDEEDWAPFMDQPVLVGLRDFAIVPAYLDVPEAERIAPGTRVKAKGPHSFDCNPGQEYLVEGYVDKTERDHPLPYYMVSTLDGAGFYCLPHVSAEVVMGPEQHAEAMKMPEAKQVAEAISSALHSMFGDEGVSVHESRVLTEAPKGWPEGEHPFTHGVEFYGRTSGGRSFGATLRLTALWVTDD